MDRSRNAGVNHYLSVNQFEGRNQSLSRLASSLTVRTPPLASPCPAHRSDCKDPTTSVVIQITDACPCKYPSNAYSNK